MTFSGYRSLCPVSWYALYDVFRNSVQELYIPRTQYAELFSSVAISVVARILLTLETKSGVHPVAGDGEELALCWAVVNDKDIPRFDEVEPVCWNAAVVTDMNTDQQELDRTNRSKIVAWSCPRVALHSSWNLWEL